MVECGNYTIDFTVQFDKLEQMNRIEARDKETCGCSLYDIVEAPELGYMSTGENLSFDFGNIEPGNWEYFIVAYDDEGNEFFYYEGSFNVLPIHVPTVSENSVSENSVSQNSVETTEENDTDATIEEATYIPVEIPVVQYTSTSGKVEDIEESYSENFFTVEDQVEGIEDIDLDTDDDDGEEEIVVNAPTIKSKSKKNGMQFKIRSDKGTKVQIKYSKNGSKKWKKLSKKNICFKYKNKKATITVKARAYVVLDDGSKVYSDWVYATEKCK